MLPSWQIALDGSTDTHKDAHKETHMMRLGLLFIFFKDAYR